LEFVEQELLNVSSEGNEGAQLLSIKKTDEVSKITGRLETAIHDVHVYIIG
jgi:hypothetical protein